MQKNKRKKDKTQVISWQFLHGNVNFKYHNHYIFNILNSSSSRISDHMLKLCVAALGSFGVNMNIHLCTCLALIKQN